MQWRTLQSLPRFLPLPILAENRALGETEPEGVSHRSKPADPILA